MKQPPSVFIVDPRDAILSSLEATIKKHEFPVKCYTSAAEFIAEQDSRQVGCVLIDPLIAAEGGAVLRWLHDSASLLSVVLISGLIESSRAAPGGPTGPIVLRPYEISALLTMVSDGLAGSLSRQVIRERSRG